MVILTVHHEDDLDAFLQDSEGPTDPTISDDTPASDPSADLATRVHALRGRRRIHLLRIAIWLSPFVFVLVRGIPLATPVVALLAVPFLLALHEFRRYRKTAAELDRVELRRTWSELEGSGT